MINCINGKWRQILHLEPLHGWMNDPNGLCYFNNKYHVYFQYSPDSAVGDGMKCWGHYESADLLSWNFRGTVLFPDTPDDKDGVYSGCALNSGNTLEIFYTGNVLEEGEHDYTISGRGANVIRVTSADGHIMSEKHTLLRNSDYPAFCSCHVRDPKVSFDGELWHMVLGARTLDDKGCVLYYSSENSIDWKYDGCQQVEDFGYMWECPDRFSIKDHTFLSVSPQGLPHSEFENQNVYSSGYFKADGALSDFIEWDYGFDFYAPQTFEAPGGRRILIGWMGIGDIPYENPTVSMGWQHCLTIPRELSVDENGEILQNPIRELDRLIISEQKLEKKCNAVLPFMLVAEIDGCFSAEFAEILKMSLSNAVFTLTFTDEKAGGKRTTRKVQIDNCKNIRIIADTSSLEIFLDNGRRVMSTRFYPDFPVIEIYSDSIGGKLYELKGMDIKYSGE